MKGYFLTIISVMLVLCNAKAQTYATLWAQYEKTCKNDLPKDGIAVLEKISTKAQKEKQYGHLIKAELLRLSTYRMISPDSIEPCKQRIETFRQQAQNGQDKALKAVWNTVMGKVYEEGWNEWDENVKRVSLFNLAMQDMDALAIKTDVYNPIIQKGITSKVFGDDLLSIIGIETHNYNKLIKYYESKGNMEAACVVAHLGYAEGARNNIDSLIERYSAQHYVGLLINDKINGLSGHTNETRAKKYAFITESLTKYPNAFGRNEIEYVLQILTRPKAELSFAKELLLPNEEAEGIINYCNINGVEIVLSRLNADRLTELDVYNAIDLAKAKRLIIKGEQQTISRTFSGYLPYEEKSVSVTFPKLKAGVYLVELKANGIKESSYDIIYVSDVSVLVESMPNDKLRINVVSSTTGKPLPGASVRLQYGYGTNIKTEVLKTNAQGEVIHQLSAKDRRKNIEFFAYTEGKDADRYGNISGIFPNYSYNEDNTDRNITTIMTDRSIYRPGQTVHVTALVYHKKGSENLRVVEDEEIELSLRDVEGKTIESKTLSTDEYGKCSTDFTLPKDCKTGNFHIRTKNATRTFKVEEYKRATFEVEIEKPDVEYKASDVLIVKAKAKTFSGAPVRMAKVNYNVCITPGGEILSDSTETDADGIFYMRMPMGTGDAEAHTDSKVWYPYWYNVVLTAYVTNASGETQKAILAMPMKNHEKEEEEKKNLHDQFEQSAEYFPRDGSPVTIKVGSIAPIYLLYSIYSGNKVIEQGAEQTDGTLKTFSLKYKEEYGEGVVVTMTWVWKGEKYTHEAHIKKPLPEKKLKMEWKTFRNRLLPGQQETWSMRILTPAGKPADASVVATMYDKSLDAIYYHKWSFEPNITRILPYFNVNSFNSHGFTIDLWGSVKNAEWEKFELSRFLPELSYTLYSPVATYNREAVVVGYGVKKYKASLNNVFGATSPKAVDEAKVYDVVESSAYSAKQMALEDASTQSARLETGTTMEVLEERVVPMRANLEETAFYMPDLRTDEDGDVRIEFTLPESVTTWRFMALANTKDVDYNVFEDEIVAQKPVMIQPNMPRFLRVGDKAQISAMVNVLDKDNQYQGTAMMEILDAETEKVIYKEKVIFNGSQEVLFHFTPEQKGIDASEDGIVRLIARFSVYGKGFEDGEQHYLNILPDGEWVKISRTFTMNEKGTLTLDLASLKADKLSIEYTANPAWLMIESLPKVASSNSHDAVSQAASYYASAISAYLLEESKTVRLDSINDYFVKDSLFVTRNKALSMLERMQTEEGGWSWYEGMPTSPYITTAVMRMLTRLNVMLGQDKSTKSLLDKAFEYMNREVAEEVKRMRKDKVKELYSDLLIDYLYISALADKEQTSDMKYLINLMQKNDKALTIHGKAVAAIILSKYGNSKDAKTYVESLKQHTVFTEEMGRYFDTSRALYSWQDYRIPSQVATIEAINYILPTDKAIAEMRRWLLQEKRTTAWRTPINTADAIYAFLNGNMHTLSSAKGYEKKDLPKSTKKYTVVKDNDGTSWGAVYAEKWQKLNSIETEGSGFSIKREIIGGNTIGERVKVRITITADRDYDFVRITDKRAACLEPVNQLSGYRWGMYVEPKDTEMVFNLFKMSKGKHVVEYECYRDRDGEYQSGTATVECTYSPEFRAQTIKVEN